MSETLFGADPAPQTPATTEQAPSPFTALVGESGKYKTPDELAKAYIHADTFIEQLKAENAQLRAKTQEAKTLDEVLERLQEAKEPQEPTSSSLTPEAVAAIVQQQITGMETAKTRQANLQAADKAMKEKFGEKAAEVYAAKANTPELQAIYRNLAETAPDQFVALFGAVVDNTPKGSIDTPTVTSGGMNASTKNKEWSKAWVAKVRKENPALYKSPQFQTDMLKNLDKYFD